MNESVPPVVQPDPFEFNATSLSVPEDALVGTVVGYIYRISGNLDLEAAFSLDNNDSNNTVFSVRSDGAVLVDSSLDYEQTTNFSISVLGTEGNRSLIQNFTVYILDVDESKPPDTQPDPLSFDATTLRISENAHLGTYLGEFFRVSGDMDINVTFSFEGQLEEDFPFLIESNGTVLVSSYLDYETQSGYLVHIRCQEGDRAVLRQFSIIVEDVFEMGLNEAPSDIKVNPEILRVKGNTDSIVQVGIFSAVDSDLSDQHQFRLVNNETGVDNQYFVLDLNGSLTTSSVLDFGLDQNLSIYVQVSDLSGASYQKKFTILYEHQEPGEDVVVLSAGADIECGWKRAGWFGYYFSSFYPWLYHQNLGWVYVSEKNYGGVWFYRNRLGWIWTSPDVFPSLYQFNQEKWTFLDTASRSTVLFDYERVEWFEVDRDFEVSGLSVPSSGGHVTGYGIYRRGEVMKIEAVPARGYLFDQWKGDLLGEEAILEIEVYSNLKLEAQFKPIVSDNATPSESISNAFEAINQVENLSPEEREKAMIELLLTGKSSAAGISQAE